MIEDYNPNQDYEHIWRVTFHQWGYKAVHEMSVGGNTRGLDTLKYALEQFAEKTPRLFYLHDAKGNTLEIDLVADYEDGCYEESLDRMVVAAELIEVRHQGFNHLPAGRVT